MEEASHAFRLHSKLPINKPRGLHQLHLPSFSPLFLSLSLFSNEIFLTLRTKLGGVGSPEKAPWPAG